MMRWGASLWALSAVLFATSHVLAHSLSPSSLSLTERRDGTVQVDLTRAFGVSRELGVVLPARCKHEGPRAQSSVEGGFLERQIVRCNKSLTGERVGVRGLAADGLGVIVQVRLVSGDVFHRVLTAAEPELSIPSWQNHWRVAQSYFAHGVTHLLSGYDHLLFVFAIAILAAGFRRAAIAITAFSLGHSITLACAALGVFTLPERAVEVAIAFSLVILAERMVSGEGVAHRAPWLAGGFGLLHGLGFAGALRATGLPREATVLALSTFNLGVEAGQLLVLSVLVPVWWTLRKLDVHDARRLRTTFGYLTGSLAAMWTLERAFMP